MILSLFILISLIISIAFIFFTKIYKEKLATSLIIIGINLFIAFICWGGIHLFNTERAMFKEVWNYKINQVQYYEKWNEQVPCRHPIYITKIVTYTETHTDSEGHTYTDTHTRTEQVYVGDEHPFDVDSHPPHWEAVDEYAHSHSISEKEYNKWKYAWGNNKFYDMHRSYYSIDGDMYYSVWNNQFDTIYPWEQIKSYKNKIRVAKSVFNFASVPKEISNKYGRPADFHNCSPILSYGISYTQDEELIFRRLNALFGKQYQIHTIIILFDSFKYPISEVENIKNAWKGANKNELVVCISLSPIDKKILWCDVFSWMDDTTIHSLIRQDVIGIETKAYSSEKLVEILKNRIPTHWKKKDFRDFDYLRVDIQFCYIIVGAISVILLNIFSSFAIAVIAYSKI